MHFGKRFESDAEDPSCSRSKVDRSTPSFIGQSEKELTSPLPGSARSGSARVRARGQLEQNSLTRVMVEREGERSTTGAWTDQAERALRVRTSAPTVEPDPGNAGGGRSMERRRTLL